MPDADQFPVYSAAERRADAAVHAIGVTAGVAGFVWLLNAGVFSGAVPVHTALALVIYGLGLVGMLTASAAYNLAPPGLGKALLRRIDHAMIFVMIAGTYTPFTLGLGQGIGLGGAVWGGAAVGATLKLRFPGRFNRLGLALYLGLGWAVVTALEPLGTALSTPALWLLIAGGLVYTIGVVFHLMERMPYNNAVWHLLVLAAASCHFAAITVAFL
ncbi:hemolysin III family protein [Azospirillum sp. CT11-132]|jgi:hemolysin III|uniref:PAQR family membrane homeostasis protein TrhA n=1 Tax=unclassified Azospirillum TaxID=2630922 RepID=UPI000D617D18|nr:MULTISPECIES: hemolysin III family protein [unclassified Azospirillum]PWC58102.1 DNA-binding protein [Azospirillum sp. TSH7]PWC67238.1 DNA-binding protein [Azospirillum sp. TSH20]